MELKRPVPLPLGLSQSSIKGKKNGKVTPNPSPPAWTLESKYKHFGGSLVTAVCVVCKMWIAPAGWEGTCCFKAGRTVIKPYPPGLDKEKENSLFHTFSCLLL